MNDVHWPGRSSSSALQMALMITLFALLAIVLCESGIGKEECEQDKNGQCGSWQHGLVVGSVQM